MMNLLSGRFQRSCEISLGTEGGDSYLIIPLDSHMRTEEQVFVYTNTIQPGEDEYLTLKPIRLISIYKYYDTYEVSLVEQAGLLHGNQDVYSNLT